MIHLLITDDKPKSKFEQLQLAPSLYKVREKGRTLVAEALDGTHEYYIVNPKDTDALIRLVQGIPLATMASDVPLKPDVYMYLMSRIRRGDLL